MEYGDFLLSVVTLCALLLTLAVVVGLVRMMSTLSRLDRLADRMGPELERLVVDARDSLRSVDRVTEQVRGIADDAKAVSAVTRQGLVPVIHQLASTGSAAAGSLAHVSALVAATKAGLRALGRNGA